MVVWYRIAILMPADGPPMATGWLRGGSPAEGKWCKCVKFALKGGAQDLIENFHSEPLTWPFGTMSKPPQRAV